MTLAASLSIGPSIHRYTAEEFLELPDHRGYEMVDGVLEEMPMGSESGWVAGELYRRMANYVIDHKLGWAFPAEVLYRCFPDDATKFRKPDASFIRFGRLENGRIPAGFIPIAPDLAVESVSPNDVATKLERKIQDYLSAGVRLIWIIYPETRTARVLRLNGQSSELHARDELGGEDVLPGFRVRLDELFQSVPA
jgi:Uma2 family endonuclease